jgi:hypothetical protein
MKSGYRLFLSVKENTIHWFVLIAIVDRIQLQTALLASINNNLYLQIFILKK